MKKGLFGRELSIVLILIFILPSGSPEICANIEKTYNINENLYYSLKVENHHFSMNNPCIEEWNRTFGGTSLDWGWSVQQTSDGGYIIAGETTSYGSGGYDAWLIKTDINGNEQWNKTFGGTLKDGSRSIQQTSDNGYILTGYTDSFGNSGHDVWLIKTDSNGNEQWDRIFGGTSSDAGFSVEQSNDGGYIITGYTYSFGSGKSDVWLVKTDSNGNEQWSKTFGGTNSEHGMSVQQTTDGGYIITGATSSYGLGSDDLWLIKTDSDGNEEWSKTFGGADNEFGGSVCQTADGGYIITGDTRSYGSGGYDVWLIKTDKDGNEQWSMIFGSFYDDTGYSVQQTVDGGYIITGVTISSITASVDVWLIKTGKDGEMEWSKIIGGKNNDYSYSVKQTKDKGYVIAGFTDSYGAGNREIWLIKIAPEEENLPPAEPIVDGTKSGKMGTEYIYTSTSTDPEGDQIYYLFDWGDGNDNGWLGPSNSGETYETTYSWNEQGSYEIKVKAKDEHGLESEWSDPLQVSMPKNKIINPFERFLENHPHMFPMMRRLLRLMN